MAKRKGTIKRETRETNIKLQFTIDGKGTSNIACGLPFMEHMLELFTRHGLFDMTIDATGDIEVDDHHLVEDMGICLGKAIKEGLGDKKGIVRYGFAQVPMDEALLSVSLDLSGRMFFVYNVAAPAKKIKNFEVQLIEEFLRALAAGAEMNLHVNMLYGKNTHHIIEGIFKALGRALDAATKTDARVQGVPSTKGVLE